MNEGGVANAPCPPHCPVVRPARPGPLLIYPGDLIGHGKLRDLALPPDARDPNVRFHDLYDQLASIKCAGLVLNDTLPEASQTLSAGDSRLMASGGRSSDSGRVSMPSTPRSMTASRTLSRTY